MVVFSIEIFVEFHFTPFQRMAPHNHQAEDLHEAYRNISYVISNPKTKDRDYILI